MKTAEEWERETWQTWDEFAGICDYTSGQMRWLVEQVRSEALEEAAKVVEGGDYLFEGAYNRGIRVRGEQAAAKIRALGSTLGGEGGKK